MAVYVRYPCPNCPRHLSLRLEYVNRRVICNHCRHPFLTRAKIRIPTSATPDLIEAINATNRAQGFSTAASDAPERANEPPDAPATIELVVLGDSPQLEDSAARDATDLASRVAQLERALAKAEIRHAHELERSRETWAGERRALEHHSDLLSVRYCRQFDDERAWQARKRKAIQAERDAAFRRVEEMALEQARLAERIVALEAELERGRATPGELASGRRAGPYSGPVRSRPRPRPPGLGSGYETAWHPDAPEQAETT